MKTLTRFGGLIFRREHANPAPIELQIALGQVARMIRCRENVRLSKVRRASYVAYHLAYHSSVLSLVEARETSRRWSCTIAPWRVSFRRNSVDRSRRWVSFRRVHAAITAGKVAAAAVKFYGATANADPAAAVLNVPLDRRRIPTCPPAFPCALFFTRHPHRFCTRDTRPFFQPGR